eukprot:COSAG06_NODE_2835_length_6201_cov_127.447722_3_plen_112_part_00
MRGGFLQSPPIAFEQNIGRWLKEHTVQTQLFVFARGKDLVEGSALRRVLAGVQDTPVVVALPFTDANLSFNLSRQARDIKILGNLDWISIAFLQAPRRNCSITAARSCWSR